MAVAAKRLSAANVDRVTLLVIYWLVIASGAKFIGAADAVQRLLLLAGVYDDIEDTQRREVLVKTIAGLGMSASVLSGVLIGLYLSFIGPKLTVLTGLTLNAVGLTCMFILRAPLLAFAGAVSMGMAYQCITNGLFGISRGFPRTSALVLSTLGAGCDVSLSSPLVVLKLVQGFGWSVPKAVTSYIVCALPAAAVVSALFVPRRTFPTAGIAMDGPRDGANDSINRNTQDNSNKTSVVETTALMKKRDGTAEDTAELPSLWTLSVYKQLRTHQFYLFAPFFILHFLRYKHFMIHMRSLYTESSGSAAIGNYYADLMSALIPFGFCAAITCGFLVDTIGALSVMVMLNSLAMVTCVTSLLPYRGVQYVAVITYCLQGGYVFGLGLSYSRHTFGPSTFLLIHGIMMTAAGVSALLFDAFWNRFVVEVLQSQRVALGVVTAVSLIMFCSPASLWCLAERKPRGADASSPSKLMGAQSDPLDPSSIA